MRREALWRLENLVTLWLHDSIGIPVKARVNECEFELLCNGGEL